MWKRHTCKLTYVWILCCLAQAKNAATAFCHQSSSWPQLVYPLTLRETQNGETGEWYSRQSMLPCFLPTMSSSFCPGKQRKIMKNEFVCIVWGIFWCTHGLCFSKLFGWLRQRRCLIKSIRSSSTRPEKPSKHSALSAKTNLSLLQT